MLAITGWGVISPIGIGIDAFTEGCTKKSSGLKPITGYTTDPLPFDEACIIPEFETTKFLGSKGTRSMDRTTGMAVAAVGMALKYSGITVEPKQDRIGVVLGTSTGSIRSISEFTRETLVQERPYLVNPALFPNTVMNCAAGQCAIWHKLKGVNATISGGKLSGLLALRYAALTIRSGYADTLLTGAVEEFCEQTAWAYYHTSSSRQKLPLGEGCAIFVLEKPEIAQANNRKILAEVLGCEFGVYSKININNAKQQAVGLASCIQKLLVSANITPSQIEVIAKCHCEIPVLHRLQDEGLSMALMGMDCAYHFSISDLIGDCFSASAAFQLAALLAFFESLPTAGNRYGLITSVGWDGTVGCMLIRAGGN
ncbi:beta-ketoacyl synthase N-terminal-like domain-containing protein [Nostoc favosum]|uniref:Beta-ketoacyl synthase-like N-terminal domain-containing protein n=1 Tax=Nostoc favosum CHAB5714 TaxID=2780399 RepID=A0ABS8IH71_9NOSO|nr:beta-ketoacyl synthase N-terminal-like domain-containing protein [Nostoc favosum]MCC5603259.1 hypothetical protein [Nostoc favosum CHAB5714]